MRYALDLAMMAILVLEMSFLFMPRPFHEILGVAFLVPIIFHVWKNRYFLKSLPRGRWPIPRIMGALIDLLLAIACFTTIISGCLISKSLFGSGALSHPHKPHALPAPQLGGPGIPDFCGHPYGAACGKLVEAAAPGIPHSPPLPSGPHGRRNSCAFHWRRRTLCGLPGQALAAAHGDAGLYDAGPEVPYPGLHTGAAGDIPAFYGSGLDSLAHGKPKEKMTF